MPHIERQPFGNTGHLSSRVIFGAAALGGMKPERAEATLSLIEEYGLNHIDTAASYGDSELRLAPYLKHKRDAVFLATKTGERTGERARAQLEASLERLGVSSVDLVQLHNLAQERDWGVAMGPGGAVEALIQAQQEGLVKHLGITGHGTYIAGMHLRSLEQHPFASVLLPYSYSAMQYAPYAADFEALYTRCQRDGIALQTIKAIAARRWTEQDADKRFSWYRPLRDAGAIARAMAYVFARPGVFLNSSSDATLLPLILEAASQPLPEISAELMAADQTTFGIEPLFIRDVSDDVQIA